MTWQVNLVHSKDAPKQLARTSLKGRGLMLKSNKVTLALQVAGYNVLAKAFCCCL